MKPFVGLRFRPVRDLLLRASYGQVFRAPSLPRLSVGVENLLDRDPSLAPTTTGGYNQGLNGRPGGTFAFVSVRRSR